MALSGEEPWQDTSHGEVLRVLEQRPPSASAGSLGRMAEHTGRVWCFPDREKTTDSAAVRLKEK